MAVVLLYLHASETCPSVLLVESCAVSLVVARVKSGSVFTQSGIQNLVSYYHYETIETVAEYLSIWQVADALLLLTMLLVPVSIAP